MKARLQICVSIVACVTLAGVGNALAFTPIGPINGLHSHRIAPPPYHSVQIIKPHVTGAPIKIGGPMYQARPRR